VKEGYGTMEIEVELMRGFLGLTHGVDGRNVHDEPIVQDEQIDKLLGKKIIMKCY
jgi:hypothetical protein